jgi:hypothetical protein
VSEMRKAFPAESPLSFGTTLIFAASGRMSQAGCIVVAYRGGRCLCCLNSNRRIDSIHETVKQ